MEEILSNDQLLGIMEQLILLSAFLGGFSATFLAAIIAMKPSQSKKVANWIIITSALAACCFIVCAASSIATVNGIHANFVELENGLESLGLIRFTSGVSMALGLFSLLSSIGMSGWLRDKQTGIATTSIAAVAIIVVSVLV
jgi:hypothetical protein